MNVVSVMLTVTGLSTSSNIPASMNLCLESSYPSYPIHCPFFKQFDESIEFANVIGFHGPCFLLSCLSLDGSFSLFAAPEI